MRGKGDKENKQESEDEPWRWRGGVRWRGGGPVGPDQHTHQRTPFRFRRRPSFDSNHHHHISIVFPLPLFSFFALHFNPFLPLNSAISFLLLSSSLNPFISPHSFLSSSHPPAPSLGHHLLFLMSYIIVSVSLRSISTFNVNLCETPTTPWRSPTTSVLHSFFNCSLIVLQFCWCALFVHCFPLHRFVMFRRLSLFSCFLLRAYRLL